MVSERIILWSLKQKKFWSNFKLFNSMLQNYIKINYKKLVNETLYPTTNTLQRFLYCNIVIYETNSLRRNPNMMSQNELPVSA